MLPAISCGLVAASAGAAAASSSAAIAKILRMGEFELQDIGSSHRERRRADSEIELPVAQEFLVVTEFADFIFVLAHARGPLAQGSGIVLAEAMNVEQLEARALRLILQPRQRWEHAAGKHIMADEVAPRAIAIENIVAHDNGLDHGVARACEPVGDGLKISGPVFLTDRFHHLYGDD